MKEITLEDCEKIAFVRGMYDSPTWSADEEKPWYYDYYNWYKAPGKRILNYQTPQEKFIDYYYGNLKTELFDGFEKKVYFLKGILKQNLTSQGNLDFANSVNLVRTCADFLCYIMSHCRIEDHRQCPKSQIVIDFDIIPCGIPMVNQIKIGKNSIDFIKDYKFKN